MSERLRECLDRYKKLHREEGQTAAIRWWEAVVQRDRALCAEWNKNAAAGAPP